MENWLIHSGIELEHGNPQIPRYDPCTPPLFIGLLAGCGNPDNFFFIEKFVSAIFIF